MKDLRDVFFYALLHKAQQDKNVVLLTADMGAFALKDFQKELPNQFFNVGISEQNMISVAAGLAYEGKQVYCYSISSFLIFRAFEQIKTDVCNMKSNVILVGIGGGVDYSYDGSTHHSIQDIGVLRTLPNMSILCPFDIETVENSVSRVGPLYIRLPKGSAGTLLKKQFKGVHCIRLGVSYVITYGMMVHNVLEILDKIDRPDIGVIAVEMLKPFDVLCLSETLALSEHIMLIEPHSEIGGLHTEIKDIPTKNKISLYAFEDKFCDIGGSLNFVQKNCGIDFDKIEAELKGWKYEPVLY